MATQLLFLLQLYPWEAVLEIAAVSRGVVVLREYFFYRGWLAEEQFPNGHYCTKGICIQGICPKNNCFNTIEVPYK